MHSIYVPYVLNDSKPYHTWLSWKHFKIMKWTSTKKSKWWPNKWYCDLRAVNSKPLDVAKKNRLLCTGIGATSNFFHICGGTISTSLARVGKILIENFKVFTVRRSQQTQWFGKLISLQPKFVSKKGQEKRKKKKRPAQGRPRYV